MIRVPFRPVAPVPIVRPNPDLVDKIIEILKENLLKPRIIDPVLPIVPRLLSE